MPSARHHREQSVTALLWAVGILAAAGAAVVTLTVERERVARRNYQGAQSLVRTTRDIWLRALLRAAQAVLLAALILGVLYLASTGPR
jgi:hypothetical protein